MRYKLLFICLLTSAVITAQERTVLSRQRAEKIAKQRNYNEEESARFVEQATTTGIRKKKTLGARHEVPSVVATASNIDFELQNFTGWMADYTTYNCTSPTPNVRNSSGFNFTSLNTTGDQTGLCTTGNDPSVTSGTLPCVCPLGGTTSCRLGDVMDGCGAAELWQTFNVTAPDTNLTVYYAAVLYDGHPPTDAPKFLYTIKTTGGQLIDSFYVDAMMASQPGSGFIPSGVSGLYYLPWQSRGTSLAAYVGQSVIVDFITSDCDGGAHRGYAYIDMRFNGQSIACGNLQTPSICFVTTNDSLKNKIYFNHVPMPAGTGTLIFRQNSMSLWDSIGFVPAGQPDAFVDTSANPNQQSYKYCASAYDSCGITYPKSSTHTTIFLQSSLGTNSSVNLSWSGYGGVPVSSYLIYRGTTPTNMSLLNQVSFSTFAYTDLNPPLGNVYYRIKFLAPAGCTSTAAYDTLVGSNYKVNNVVGIDSYSAIPALSVYPNPASSIVTLECNTPNVTVCLTDILGNTLRQSVCKTGKMTFEIDDLPEGVYFISIKNNRNQEITTKKLIVRR